jgi:formyltetrahydrofolate synthetase
MASRAHDRSTSTAFSSDLEIARGASLTPLVEVGAAMELGSHLLEPYGEHVMKVKTAAIDELAQAPRAKYVVVTAITPTPLGEGRSRVGRRVVATARSPRPPVGSR